MSSNTNLNNILNNTALKESGIQYMILIAILVSSLKDLVPMGILVALCCSYLSFLFGGYLKKIAEMKLDQKQKLIQEKDDELQKLKDEKADNRAEIHKLSAQVEDLKIIKSKLEKTVEDLSNKATNLISAPVQK